jgi:hypothetical protein
VRTQFRRWWRTSIKNCVRHFDATASTTAAVADSVKPVAHIAPEVCGLNKTFLMEIFYNSNRVKLIFLIVFYYDLLTIVKIS